MKEHQQTFWYGLIESNSDDPLKLGRCRVRVLGVHDPDPEKQPVEDLPWAHVLQMGGAGSGLGFHSVPEIGTDVLVTFLDPETKQQPIVLGCLNTVHGGGQGGGGSDTDADGNPLSGGTASENNQDLGSVEYNGEMIFKPEWFTALGVSASNADTLAKGYSKWWLKICASQKENYEQMARILGCNYGETGFKPNREGRKYSDYSRAKSTFSRRCKTPAAEAHFRECWQKGLSGGAEFLNYCYADEGGNGSESSGDGDKFRGGGMIQLTYRKTYTRCASAMGLSNAEDLAAKITELDYAIGSSVWYWWNFNGKSSPGFQPDFESSLKQVGKLKPEWKQKRISAYNKVKASQQKS